MKIRSLGISFGSESSWHWAGFLVYGTFFGFVWVTDKER